MKLPQVGPPRLPTRREMLQLMGVGAAYALVPGCAPPKKEDTATPYKLKFLTATEAVTLGALADTILPPDSEPGGAQLGVVEYVDRLLSAFEGGGPIYAGGPNSGRRPFPNADGTPSKNSPANDFAEALPLDRVQEKAWRLMLYGSDGVTGGGPNDAIEGQKVVGLRNEIRSGLAAVAGLSDRPLDKLSLEERTALINDGAFDKAFRDQVIELVSEGAFSVPEYGGNKDLGGWKLTHNPGDAQPLGFSWFDTTTGSYKEDPNFPVSKANPYPDPAPLTSETREMVTFVIETFLGGKTFS